MCRPTCKIIKLKLFSNFNPDSYCRYGVQQMNQSRDKPDIVITHIKDLGVNLNEKTVTIRGRLHTSRAKGEFSLSLSLSCLYRLTD